MNIFVYFCLIGIVAVHSKKETLVSEVSDSDVWDELAAAEDKQDSDVTGRNANELESDKMTDEMYEKLLKLQVREARHLRREQKQRMRDEKAEIRHGKACVQKKCALGKECVIDEDDEPICVCAKACADEENERAMVCTTHNVTFASECELKRQRCLCHTEALGCADPTFAHAHIDYFGPCVDIRPCSDFEKGEFPLRMREWLYFVMEELAGRDALNEKALGMAKKAEEANQAESDDVTDTERYIIPAVWKFCDLDSTHDDLVDNGELMPVIAPLKGMEHCIGAFIEECDKNQDGTISKTEWIKCLQLDPKLVNDLEMRCDEFHD